MSDELVCVRVSMDVLVRARTVAEAEVMVRRAVDPIGRKPSGRRAWLWEVAGGVEISADEFNEVKEAQSS